MDKVIIWTGISLFVVIIIGTINVASGIASTESACYHHGYVDCEWINELGLYKGMKPEGGYDYMEIICPNSIFIRHCDIEIIDLRLNCCEYKYRG